jgi:hypothetical protein
MLALLPLDNRPCNFRFPAEIAEIGGDSIVRPDNSLLGRFNTPANVVELEKWLEELPEVSAVIVSIDMLAYGGLVASRKTATSLDTALTHLDVLKRFRAKRPDVPIYAFNVLMRLAITMDSDAAVPHYYNVMRYARLVDEAARFPSDEKAAELAEVQNSIPVDILDEYRAARKRNHAVNLKMIEWLSEGVFDYLLITQEDCTEFGLHRLEQDELTEKAASLAVTDKFSLHPGADEAALTLLAHHWQTDIKFKIHWSDEAHKRDIAVFEDVPYEDALKLHIGAMGGQIVETEPEVHLFVNAPVGGSQRNETQESKTARTEKLTEFVAEIEKTLDAGLNVAVCDVAFPNGADNLLMQMLHSNGTILPRLTAFGGWNTAGNTTGTVLAQCAAFKRGGDKELNRQFLFERIVDDWFYQAKVRTDIEKVARDHGFSPLNMNGHTSGIELLAREQLTEFAEELAGQFEAKVDNMVVTLPWGRTFEVEFAAQLT